MNTARDLLLITLDPEHGAPADQGALSLALAGGELIDLMSVEAVAVPGERVVPGLAPSQDDDMLSQAVSSLVREQPYELVDDWLWRRGRGLAAEYVTRLRAEGLVARKPHRSMPARLMPGRPETLASAARRAAVARWEEGEPVLQALAAALRRGDESAVDASGLPDPVVTVLAAVGGAELELEAERQRRSVENAAFDNIWRGA
ncbi:GPP34 family phosphoprotein [Streptomyces sp. NPDC050145]|uniref:GPP34 family phosphoprotein n=1 Tax=Streptomyces sp. NPDC050145 TaxID=3365602 RepID=UPI0037984A09